jgi:gluconokinase
MAGASIPTAILVMGVSGSGKTTLALALAQVTGYSFIEGDGLHPQSNVAKMVAGVPLNDSDRWPWLVRISDSLSEAAFEKGGVATCSALKRAYRDLIRERAQVPVVMVYLDVPRTVLAARMAARQGHFMPASLLDSQLATLEVPGTDEAILRIDGQLSLQAQVASVLKLWGGTDF